MKVVMDVFLCYVLCMLTALVPSCSSLDKKEFTFYLDETHASEGSWKNGPLLPETDRYNNNGATYFWREQNGRHPYVEFTTLGTEKITMDSFVSITYNLTTYVDSSKKEKKTVILTPNVVFLSCSIYSMKSLSQYGQKSL